MEEKTQEKIRLKEIKSSIMELIHSARKHTGKFEFNQALDDLERANDEIVGAGDIPISAELETLLMSERAKIFRLLGKWEEALIDYNSIIMMKDTVSDPVPVIHSYLGKGEILANRGRYKEALDLFKDALSIADRMENKKEIAHCCYSLGMFYSRMGESTSGKRLLERAKRIALEHKDVPGMNLILAAVENQFGLIEFRNSELEKAHEIFKNAMESLEELKLSLEYAEASRYLGVVSGIRKNYRKSLEYHLIALDIYNKIGYKLGQAKVYNSIGQTCVELGKLDIAVHFMEKAEKICRSLGADTEAATIYGKLGNIYMMKEEYDRAKALFNRDIEMSQKFENIRALAFAYRNIGVCNVYLGQNKDAVRILSRSVSLFRKMGDKIQERKVKLDLCEAYINEGSLDEAEKLADNFSKDISPEDVSMEAAILNMILGIINRHRKRWEKSRENFEKSAELIADKGESMKLSELYYEYGLLCLGMNDREGALSKFKKAFKIASELGLDRQKERYFRMIERIDELEIIRMIIEEIYVTKVQYSIK